MAVLLISTKTEYSPLTVSSQGHRVAAGTSLKELLQVPRQPVKANMLLRQAQSRANVIGPQTAIPVACGIS
jgi:hypothetical protein